MALYAQALIGVGPIGSTQAGALSTLLGAPWAMAIGAALAGSVIVAIRVARPQVFAPAAAQPIPAKASERVSSSSSGIEP